MAAKARHRGLSPPLGLVAVALAAIGLLVTVDWFRDLLPSFSNPFATRTVDRSEPAVLRSMKDLREYRAASGHFQVVVDLEKDTVLPSQVLGERTLFVAVGNVDATVDFTQVDAEAIRVSSDRRKAVITLPQPELSEAELDLERSRVFDRDRGLLNRVGGVFFGGGGDERELYLLAEDKLEEAARNGSGLVARGESNTRTMLQSLLRSLGFRSVTVRFEVPPGT